MLFSKTLILYIFKNIFINRPTLRNFNESIGKIKVLKITYNKNARRYYKTKYYIKFLVLNGHNLTKHIII